ncbi:MAG: hypothetical protein U5J64_02615 [Halobacteriales archaeon]|nr:hypothetical protein [Halobacteriales archaeon]
MSNEPKHVRGLCDIADCEGVASRAYRDEEAGLYVEVCAEHATSLGGFDSDYERVEHDSPHREPESVEKHACGGDLHVYTVETQDGDGDADTHRVCAKCGYAVLIHDTGEKSMSVKAESPDET